MTSLLHAWRDPSGAVTLLKVSFLGEDDTCLERYVRPDAALSRQEQAAQMEREHGRWTRWTRWTRWVSNLSLVSFHGLQSLGFLPG